MVCEFRSVWVVKFVGAEMRMPRGAGESARLIRFLTESTMLAAAKVREN